MSNTHEEGLQIARALARKVATMARDEGYQAESLDDPEAGPCWCVGQRNEPQGGRFLLLLPHPDGIVRFAWKHGSAAIDNAAPDLGSEPKSDAAVETVMVRIRRLLGAGPAKPRE